MYSKRFFEITKYFIPFIVAIIFAAIYTLDALDFLSNQVNDLIYQRGDIPSGEVSLLQIDEHSLQELGPYNTWTRDYVAEAIEMLNADADTAPDVIGVDILYIGNTNEESDAHLVEAASIEDNVVFGSFINTDMVLTEEDGVFSMEEAVTLYEEPFEELKAVSDVGFVNGFLDKDGVVRHSIQNFQLEDGRTVPSLASAIYRKYAEKNGLEIADNIITNERGYYYVNFTGAPGDYSDSFSLSDYIQGEIPTEYFTGGIVLIGPYAEAMMDSYTTPVDKSSPMYGMEVHANLVENYLNGDFKREVKDGVQLIVLIVAVMLAVIMCFGSKLRGSIIYSCFTVIGYPLACIWMYRVGYVLDVLYVPVAAVIVMVVNIVRHYLVAARDKHRVEKTFKRYVAPEIVDQITETGLDNIKLGGEAVECAILFVDIRGFTTMSEALEPEQVVSILNKYLELTSESIFKYGGTLDKFIGDATMAIFGAPLPQEDYIYNAVRAAWNMIEESKALAKELEEEFGRAVSFGVGVHCGKAVVGNIGTSRRMDYTAIGDTVNTAARLEANAPKNTVYISKKVVDAIGDRVTVQSIGNLPLKGKSEELEVFKLVGIE